MAQVVVTLKIMPESPESDLSLIRNRAKEQIKKFTGNSVETVDVRRAIG